MGGASGRDGDGSAGRDADHGGRSRGGRRARFRPAVARPLLRGRRRGAHPGGYAIRRSDRLGGGEGRRRDRLGRRRRRSRSRRLRRCAARARSPPRGPRRRRGRRVRAGLPPRASRDLGDVRRLEGRAAGRPPRARRLGHRLLCGEDPPKRGGAQSRLRGLSGRLFLRAAARGRGYRQRPRPHLPLALRLPLHRRQVPQADGRLPALRERSWAGLGDLARARRRHPALHRQGRPHAHRAVQRRPGDRRRRLQLLHRLLLPTPGDREAGDGRRVAGAPARRPHRHGPLQELRPLRAALPIRRYRLSQRRPPGAGTVALPRLRPRAPRAAARRRSSCCRSWRNSDCGGGRASRAAASPDTSIGSALSSRRRRIGARQASRLLGMCPSRVWHHSWSHTWCQIRYQVRCHIRCPAGADTRTTIWPAARRSDRTPHSRCAASGTAAPLCDRAFHRRLPLSASRRLQGRRARPRG